MTALEFDVRLDACTVCGQPLARFDEPIIKGIAVRYDACASCGLVQMNPRPSEEALEAFYAHAYRANAGDEQLEQTGDAQRRRSAQQRDFLGATPRRHLDVGCSTGLLLQTIGAPEQVGVEPGEQHRRAAAEVGIEVHASIEDLVATDPEPFDLITMSHVLEHLADPVGFLPALRPLLAPGGRLLLEVPHLYRSIAYELAHLLVFSPPSLTATLRAAGWTVVDTRIHVARQGGLGNGRNICVLAVPSEPVAPEAGSHPVVVMQAKRRLGFAPQRLYRWRRRQQRLVTRNVRKLRRRVLGR
jgi:SAM-dependent methyltransferase